MEESTTIMSAAVGAALLSIVEKTDSKNRATPDTIAIAIAK